MHGIFPDLHEHRSPSGDVFQNHAFNERVCPAEQLWVRSGPDSRCRRYGDVFRFQRTKRTFTCWIDVAWF